MKQKERNGRKEFDKQSWKVQLWRKLHLHMPKDGALLKTMRK